MNEAAMTIRGNVVETPNLRKTKSGYLVANFRVASTPSRFDREKNTWVDGETLFLQVTCWRALAENVAHSLRKGQPVIIMGRFCQHEYTKDETLRTVYELEATAVGHDLTRGVATFEKATRSQGGPAIELDADGLPADQTAHYLDLDDEFKAEIDVETGEVRELAAVS